ncbi:hypothetical protein HDV05_006006 [Chytridiales sp. JEL 0842]|nr:hypothetical protein HDV05_006006 [Chytridiales sp. JEL 0842]
MWMFVASGLSNALVGVCVLVLSLQSSSKTNDDDGGDIERLSQSKRRLALTKFKLLQCRRYFDEFEKDAEALEACITRVEGGYAHEDCKVKIDEDDATFEDALEWADADNFEDALDLFMPDEDEGLYADALDEVVPSDDEVTFYEL